MSACLRMRLRPALLVQRWRSSGRWLRGAVVESEETAAKITRGSIFVNILLSNNFETKNHERMNGLWLKPGTYEEHPKTQECEEQGVGKKKRRPGFAGTPYLGWRSYPEK